MSTSIGFDIYARDRASKTLDKIGHSAQRSGGMFKAMGAAAKYAAVGLAAGAAGGVLAAKSLYGMGQQASDLNETISKTNQIFGDAVGGSLERWASKAATALGQSKQTALDAAATFGVFGKSAGKSGMELAKFAMQNTKLATDLASFHNTSPQEAIEALGAAFRGEAEPMRKYGVLLDDASMRIQALKMGLVETTKEALTPQQKVLAAQALIMKQTSDAQGDFSRTSDGLANQQRILAARFANLRTEIGSKVLPVMSGLASWALTKGMPALSNFSDMLQRKLGPAIRDLAAWFRSEGIPAIMRFGAVLRGDVLPAVVAAGQAVLRTVQFFNQHRTAAISLATAIGVVVAITKIHAAVMAVQAAGGLVAMIKGLRIVTSVTRAYAAVQWALNAALTANPIGLVVMGLVALGVGLAVAYRKSDTFRRIVNAAFASVKNVVGSVVRWLGKYVPAVFGFVVGAVKGYVSVYRAVVVGAFNAVRAVVSGVMNAVKAVTNASWGDIVRATQQGVGKVVSFVKSLPGRMLGALGNLSHLLWNAGASVIQGLIDGVQSKVSALTSKLHAITNLIPLHKGPISKDRILLQPAGAAIMAGLIEGLRRGERPLAQVLEKVTANVQATGDKLKGLMSARRDFAAGFQGFASSIFGADTGDGAAPTVDSILTYAATQRDQAAQVQTDVRRLMRMGLSKSLIRQMQESGSSGIAQMHALAGGNSQQIALLNSLNAQTSRDLAGAGSSAAGAMFNSDIREAQRDKRLADAIAQAIHRLAAGDKGEIHIHLEGRTLVESIRKHQRNKGEKPTV